MAIRLARNDRMSMSATPGGDGGEGMASRGSECPVELEIAEPIVPPASIPRHPAAGGSSQRLAPFGRTELLANRGMLDAYLSPPTSPQECVFARLTRCVSADLETQVTPCQFGGTPDCANCGCVASIGLHAIGRHTLPGGLRVGRIFDASLRVGGAVRKLRSAARN
jgi:hypothetical protein